MRNLKRALSLTLASVMLLGMMVVGTSAAKGYDDVKDTDNVEAIEVLQEIEVMVGDERGFGPDRPVNRAEMAVVMGKLLNLDYNYYSAACPFNDVYDWARGYVGACYANKILSGRSATVYDPGSTVTAVEAAMMLMRALGYFQYSNDVADGWVLATVAQGNKIGIFDNVDASADSAMTRNQVAQMVLNALQSAVVEPDGNTTTFLNPDGTVLATTGKVNYVSVTSNKPFARAIGKVGATSIGSTNDGYIVELGERLYNGELKLTDHTIDSFGRPSRYWEYKGNAIGTYAKKELLVESFNLAVKGRDAYNLLGQTAIDDKDLLVFVDGAENSTLPAGSQIAQTDLRRSNTNNLNSTGRGVVTEFYVDNDYDEITIAIINNYLAGAQNDYNTTTEDIRLGVYYGVTASAGKPDIQAYPVTIEVEDYAMVEQLKADDLVRVTMAAPDHVYNSLYTGYTIESMDTPDVVSDATLSDYSVGNDVYTTANVRRLSNVTTDGTRYEAAAKAFHDEELFFQYSGDVETQLRDATYDLYLDQFGNILGIEQVTKEDRYIFVVGYDQGSSVLAQAIDQALIIHTDGTMETVKIDDSKLKIWNGTAWADVANKRLVPGTGDDPNVNAWFTYSVKSDGTYVLDKLVDRQGVQNRTLANVAVPAGDNERAYIDAKHGSVTTAADINMLTIGHNISAATAYGNDNSVYIAVEANTDVATSGSIVKVRGVTTGLRNASVRPDDVSGLTGMTGNTYFMYNSRGFVTYAVVVGTDGSAGYKYIYLNSSIKRTTDDKTNDRYLYTFEGIMDGELKTFQSTENMAVESTAAAGNINEDVPTVKVHPGKYDMIRAEINADGLVTKMVKLDPTATGEMRPDLNDDYGYTFKLDSDTANTGADDISRLELRGNTLWVIGTVTEDNYTLLDVPANFFVRNPANSSTDFTVYTNAEQAVNAVNNIVSSNQGVIKAVATMNTAVTGYANTVVVDLTYTTSAPVGPTGKITTLPAVKTEENDTSITVYVPLVDKAGADRNTELSIQVGNELANKGYFMLSNTLTAGALSGSEAVNGIYRAFSMNGNGTSKQVIVKYQDFRTVKVDTRTVEYVRYNTNSFTQVKDVAGAYAGFVQTYATATHDTVTYKAYNSTSTTAVQASMQYPVTIETGYVAVDNTAATATTVADCAGNHVGAPAIAVTGLSRGDTNGDGTADGDWYFKGTNGFTVAFTGAAAGTDGAHDVRLAATVTGGASQPTVSLDHSFTATEWNAGSAAHTFTVSGAGFVAANKITALTATLIDPPAAAAVTLGTITGVPGTPVKGVEISNVTLSANAATAKIGDTVTLTMTIKGPASAAATITIAGAGVGSSSNESFSANANSGALAVTGAKTLGVTANVALPETTVTWSFTVGAAGAITVTVA